MIPWNWLTTAGQTAWLGRTEGNSEPSFVPRRRSGPVVDASSPLRLATADQANELTAWSSDPNMPSGGAVHLARTQACTTCNQLEGNASDFPAFPLFLAGEFARMARATLSAQSRLADDSTTRLTDSSVSQAGLRIKRLNRKRQHRSQSGMRGT